MIYIFSLYTDQKYPGVVYIIILGGRVPIYRIKKKP